MLVNVICGDFVVILSVRLKSVVNVAAVFLVLGKEFFTAVENTAYCS